MAGSQTRSEADSDAADGANSKQAQGTEKSPDKSLYEASDIDVIEGLEAVRKRPGMYIGSTGPRGLHHLVYEVVDNAIDEALAGYCDTIEVTILADGGVRVSDNGRGIPVEEHPKFPGVSAVEIVLTILHAGGKFGGGSYAVSGGLHGVGVSVVNALSSRLLVEVARDGGEFRQEFANGGHSTGPLQRVGDTDLTGTTVTFWPDDTIFETTKYDSDILVRRIRELAFLNRGVRLRFVDERPTIDDEAPAVFDFYFEGGIQDFVKHLNAKKEPLISSMIYLSGKREDFDGAGIAELEIALQWNHTYQESVFSFANTINTHEGGTHEEGFRAALTNTINRYSQAANLVKPKDENFAGEDCREGLTGILSVKLSNPQFEGQTKTKLGNTEMKSFVQTTMNSLLGDWLEAHPGEAKLIIEKCKLATQSRLAARKARELTRRKGLMDAGGLPGKLVDCTSTVADECEIFIVEGNSAGGSAVKARVRDIQAILPIRGKILNVEKSRLDKVLANNEVRSLISAIGAGIGEDFDLSKVRYHKIITLADADVDGSHIRTLLLTFFFRYMPQIVEAGYVYSAQPPLFAQRIDRNIHYLFSDRELEVLRGEHADRKLPSAQRYKGLGEMDYEELWSTTMNPETRVLRKVTIDDAAIADEIFSTLMGDDVEVRKEFIRANASDVRFLDI